MNATAHRRGEWDRLPHDVQLLLREWCREPGPTPSARAILEAPHPESRYFRGICDRHNRGLTLMIFDFLREPW